MAMVNPGLIWLDWLLTGWENMLRKLNLTMRIGYKTYTGYGFEV